MNLTGKQLVEQGIVTGNITEDNIAQHGVDLCLIQVMRILGSGFIPKEGKTDLAAREKIEPFLQKIGGKARNVWSLDPGSYDITFEQGCKVPPNQRLQIVQRSSALRNGTILVSSLFDSGFYTDHIGTVMIVNERIYIEEGARVAQIYATVSNEVENLYNGQYQNDAQRKGI